MISKMIYGMISSQDIRIFRISAQHWFGFENKRQLQTYKNTRPRGPHLKSNPNNSVR
jgi:hypothetical protein